MSTAIIYTDDATRYFDHYKCKHCEKVEWREGSFGPTWWRLSRYETSSGIYNGLFCSDCFSKKMENKFGQTIIVIINNISVTMYHIK